MTKFNEVNKTEYTSDELKKCLLEILKFVKKFFNEKGLHYVACGGTVLGAVRHKGFIPWDDDIDIYLPRADYDKLLAMNDELNSYGYEVISYRNTGYYMPFAKISHLSSTIWEIDRYRYIFGVFIDLFPLDEFEQPDEVITALQYKSHFYFDKYMNALSYYPVSHLINSILHFDLHQTGLYILNCYRKHFKEKYLQDFIDFEQTYKGGKGSKTVCVTQWEGRIFQSQWFKDVIEMPFEDTTITIPRAYDDYLKLLYGDYMTLPPEDKRISHPHFYADLHHRHTIEEILNS